MPVGLDKLKNSRNRAETKVKVTKKVIKCKKMQLDVDVSPPAISLLVDMNPKC